MQWLSIFVEFWLFFRVFVPVLRSFTKATHVPWHPTLGVALTIAVVILLLVLSVLEAIKIHLQSRVLSLKLIEHVLDIVHYSRQVEEVLLLANSSMTLRMLLLLTMSSGHLPHVLHLVHIVHVSDVSHAWHPVQELLEVRVMRVHLYVSLVLLSMLRSSCVHVGECESLLRLVAAAEPIIMASAADISLLLLWVSLSLLIRPGLLQILMLLAEPLLLQTCLPITMAILMTRILLMELDVLRSVLLSVTWVRLLLPIELLIHDLELGVDIVFFPQEASFDIVVGTTIDHLFIHLLLSFAVPVIIYVVLVLILLIDILLVVVKLLRLLVDWQLLTIGL